MSKCNCRSYNGDFGETPETVLTIPDHFGFHYSDEQAKEQADKVRQLIAEVDDRKFKLQTWILTEV